MKDDKSIDLETQANREIGVTNVSRPVALLLTVAFLALVCGVPAVQLLSEFREFRRGERRSALPGCCEIVPDLAAALTAKEKTPETVLKRILRTDRRLLRVMADYEAGLEESSWLAGLCLPYCQSVLSCYGGAGNEKAYVGRKRWLFYRQDVESLTSMGFSAPAWQRKRKLARREWDAAVEPDPVKAILGFRKMLAARGIQLVLMPVPEKTVIHGDLMHRKCTSVEGLRNRSYQEFVRTMRDAGITVFDPAPLLLERKAKTGLPQYLERDTHWRPDAMECVASDLAELLKSICRLEKHKAGTLAKRQRVAENHGDLSVLLRLPLGASLSARERVVTHQVTRDGERWSESHDAEVLVLGDSFANIYSLKSMGWGESAGLVEQLSYALGVPVDRIVQNDNGSHVTRERLMNDQKAGLDRLRGKKIVVWEFAARELPFGNWME